VNDSPRPFLSAALIVRDEARHLGGCLASIAPIADEAVVVDTGSADATAEVARRAGASVSSFAWNGSFADARNAALERCRGEWILYIDADERVEPARREALAALSQPGWVACRVPFHPRPGYTPYLELRLFRNLPSIRFRGRIHETVVPAIDELLAKTDGRVGLVELPIYHLGYEGDLADKHRRNLPLLREAVRDDPERLFLWCDLARAAAALGQDAEAEAAWARAIALAERSRARAGLASLPFIDLIDHRAGRGAPIAVDLERALALFPESVPLRWRLGRERLRDGRSAEALAIFEALLRLGEAGAREDDLSFDARLVGVFPMEAIADCLSRLGRFAEALEWLKRALDLEPDSLELRAKAAIASARAARAN
jgi:tetratricopeptide (TPR) repeat protein